MVLKIDDIVPSGCYLLSYRHTEGKIKTTTSKGRYRSTMSASGMTVEAGTLELNIAIKAESERGADLESRNNALQRDMAGDGVHEITIIDHNVTTYYRGILTSMTTLQVIPTKAKTVKAILSVVKHGELQSVSSSNVYCRSTVPYTDCIITVTAASAGTVTVAGVKFTGVAAGDVLTVDSINMQILKNGEYAADSATFSAMPKLVPGINKITTSQGSISVKYYPTYL